MRFLCVASAILLTASGEDITVCTKEFKPVCGSDDKVYSNACTAEAAGQRVQYEIKAPGDIKTVGQDCPPEDEKPAVGMESCGPTSTCVDCVELGCAWTADECMTGCLVADVACYTTEGDRTPAQVCLEETEAKADAAACNLKSCNECVSTALPSDKTKTCRWFGSNGGFCGSACGLAGCGETECLQGGGDEDPIVCTKEWKPVCGSDDKVYSNACTAVAEGQKVQYEIETPDSVTPGKDCPPESVGLFLQQSFNYEAIESETSLSAVRKSQPVAFAATFTNLWTRDRHPFRFPSNRAHWSPMVFASHADAYRMWCDDCIATDGVKLIAETGRTSTLVDEINAQRERNVVLDQKTAPSSRTPVGFGEESTVDGSLCFDERHPLASAISMIAPSPDWFSGLYDLRLWKENSDGDDVWYDRFQAYVYAWDAGTEEGDSYSPNNRPTTPREGMRPFTAGSRTGAVFVSRSPPEVRVEDVTCTSRRACNQKRLEMGFSIFSTGNFPTKGCFSKNDRAYWSDGTDEQISRLDLPGVQQRIRCDEIVEDGGGDLRVLPVGIITFELQGTSPECTSMSDASMADSTEDSTCTSRQACNQKRLEMGFSTFRTGNFPTKGCFSKNDRAYWSDGTDEQISRLDLPGVQQRILCDKIA